ncbi:MAG: ribosome assembly cofactor RimP [Flavobacteriales bacterium]|jgi:ribosome maturation factor RimP|nr:ribosome assembly cofactor RimP [Flavobacteriales bacterium]MCW8912859.1 ribosome assembly cofactor RimP [Flavobacteriales bacterium]MCW8937208.1 ribosome assembly cofactor RimP [Flavobacteriales bacterium]MCW8941246.1 ribosome assembly cofactor RimP [Flavobacteriales bacterium]MCW8967831.1 ribosome assembly cofactor RimP [Flavobacteriales bacterium]
MITEEKILSLVTPTLEEKNAFVVMLDIRPGNNILLEVDSLEGVKISDCVDISRAIEHNLDRETEDFELQVSSPGLDKPLRVKQQYEKNVGRELKIITNDDVQLKGKLIEVNDEQITIEMQVKEKVGKKKKISIQNEQINFNNIKETKIIISFK